MTKNNVIYDEEDLEMLSDLKDAKENGLDFIFTYRGNSYRIEFVSGIVLAYMEKENAMEFRFQNIDDLMEHYMIDGEPFKNIIPEIDSYEFFDFRRSSPKKEERASRSGLAGAARSSLRSEVHKISYILGIGC